MKTYDLELIVKERYGPVKLHHRLGQARGLNYISIDLITQGRRQIILPIWEQAWINIGSQIKNQVRIQIKNENL